MSRSRGAFKLSRPVERTVAAGRHTHAHRTRHLSFTNPIRAWGPAFTWATVLFLLSAVPAVGGPDWLPVSDKVVHFGLFAVLGATLAWGRHRSGARIAHGWLLLIGILYGMTDEWHQMYVPGRMPDLADWVADAFGVVTGYGTTAALLGRRRADRASAEGRHEEEPASTGGRHVDGPAEVEPAEEEPTGDGS